MLKIASDRREIGVQLTLLFVFSDTVNHYDKGHLLPVIAASAAR